ncbi:TRAP transporter large permease subunit [Selenomonas sp. TAMA-11512]|uniref:TRAP transporter large permease n=1 Tax=Selenomonas sp. TAMA-11512 TaxID=3095337 RepID=UPI003091B700|nr:TRAP transporter large permease subunit [Selenomonas sp. TAMA-11512]
MLLLFLLSVIVLLLLGMPVAYALSFAGMIGMYFFIGGAISFPQIPGIAYKTLDDFVITAVPLYILMSYILLKGKVGTDLFDLGNKWLRHLPGGLAVATILACAIFASISGSSVATAVTIGTIAIPEMLRRGYPKTIVYGTVAAGGTLGILIPPSIPMILYGSITGVSVGKLFLSGIVPGVLLTGLFMLYIVVRSRHGVILQEAAPWSERIAALKHSAWGLFLPLLIIGGIYTGLFTPTEAAAVGTFYALFITFFIYKSLTLSDMREVLEESAKTTSMIFAIMIGAMLFGFVLTVLQAPQLLVSFVTEVTAGRWVIFIGINIVLLALGCMLETVSIILITLPILYPIVRLLGFDLIWFNVIMLINMELALITPPVGMNLFVIKGIAKNGTISDIVRGSIPFAILMVSEIILLCLVPELATWLPKVLQ